MNIWRLYLL